MTTPPDETSPVPEIALSNAGPQTKPAPQPIAGKPAITYEQLQSLYG